MEMTEMGNGKWKHERSCISSKHSATELAVTMMSQAYRLAVVLQPLLLCWGEDQLFVTKTNGKATEIVSVHSGGVNSLVSTVRNSPSYYDSFFFHNNFTRACNKDQAPVYVLCM